MRLVAVDWSGRRKSEKKHLYIAEIGGNGSLDLSNSRSRQQTCDYLIEKLAEDSEVVVGLDFGFSFPCWFVRQRGFTNVRHVWNDAKNNGEHWLAECESPFWGRTGTKCPNHDGFRKTEADITGSVRPKSLFQINGAGSVGTGSIRGMPHLARLQDEGFNIWPFADGLPMVLEIYPRLLTGPISKNDEVAKRRYLDQHYPQLDETTQTLMVKSEDAFDAGVSVLVMQRHRIALRKLKAENDAIYLLEGKIWSPNA